jgi:hypothetical protein
MVGLYRSLCSVFSDQSTFGVMLRKIDLTKKNYEIFMRVTRPKNLSNASRMIFFIYPGSRDIIVTS